MTLELDSPPEELHGGIDRRELQALGKTAGEVLDLSSNVLFVRHPPTVRQALRETCLSEYPDRDGTELRQRLAERHAIDAARIVLGNGCCELIDLLARSVIDPGDRVLVAGPTFSEYRRVSANAGARVETIAAGSVPEYSRCLELLSDRLEVQSARLVWICNPNNPTGASHRRDGILHFARGYPSTIVVVDESYIEFAATTKSLIGCDVPNIAVLRSLTKSHALAGLRLGYLIASEPVVDSLLSKRIPWSVNAAAQAVGAAALAAQSHYDRAMANMASCRGRLIEELQRRGLSPYPSEGGFVLVPIENSAEFRSELLARNVLVRDCDSFGLANHVRIAVGDDEAIDRLLLAIDRIDP
ncbi:MAG: histidinol-phosphate transaminase, partial [Planctomycetota bacterium]